MRALLSLSPALLLACSAPSLDEAPDRGPAPSPAELAADRPTPSPAPPTAAPAVAPPAAAPPAAAPSAEPTAPPPPIAPTAPAHIPAAPFTAWTTTAPLTLVGDRGQPTATLKRLGVRVEVLEVTAERVRVQCVGCGESAAPEGWMQPGAVRAAKAPGGSSGVLEAALRHRAGWAGGRELPPDTTNAQLCALLNHGFELDDARATWSLGDGRATFDWDGRRWALGALVPPSEPPRWSCRADGGQPPPPAPKDPR